MYLTCSLNVDSSKFLKFLYVTFTGFGVGGGDTLSFVNHIQPCGASHISYIKRLFKSFGISDQDWVYQGAFMLFKTCWLRHYVIKIINTAQLFTNYFHLASYQCYGHIIILFLSPYSITCHR